MARFRGGPPAGFGPGGGSNDDGGSTDTDDDDEPDGGGGGGGGGDDFGDPFDGGGGGGRDFGGGGGGGSPGGSSPPPSDVGGPADPAPAPEPEPPAAADPGPVFGDGSSSDGGGGGSPGGSSPPPSDVGGPADPVPDDPAADMVADDPGPVFGPGPGTDGGLGDPDPGGDLGVTDDVAEFVTTAEANPEIVDRATTGGVLSERGENAGLLPPTAVANTPRGQLETDISETRLRETAAESFETGQDLDLGAVTGAQAAVVAPFTGGQGVDPTGEELDPLGDPDPGTEGNVEEYLEGAAALPFDAPGALAETETVAEAGQSLVVDDQLEDFGAGEVAETATAQGRDRAEQTAAAARQNPAGFAGGISAGLLAGGAGVAAGGGAASGLRAGLRAEVDPRIGPFGTTIETRAARGVRDFLDDDRGQAQLLPESRDRGTDTDAGTVTDDDLGPDLDAFDRSDTRLFDPNREFGDVGGMADRGPTVDPTDASSREDIGGGIGGRGEAGVRGSDAESFSSRGFGDDIPPELDPNPTTTLLEDLNTPGAATGGLLAAPESDLDALSGADGLLGAPADLDSTGTTAEVDADTLGGVDLDTGFTPATGPDADVFSRSDAGTDTRQDTPTDTRQDTPTDLFTDPVTDQPTDQPTDPVTDLPTDVPTDTPTDVPTDIPTDTPDDRRERFPFDFEEFPDAAEDGLRLDLAGETVTNPTQTLEEADRFVVDTISDGF